MSNKCACHIKLPDGTKIALKDSEARAKANENTELIDDLAERVVLLESASGVNPEGMLTKKDLEAIESELIKIKLDVESNAERLDTAITTIGEHTNQIGDIETALDGIITIQNDLIGGDS